MVWGEFGKEQKRLRELKGWSLDKLADEARVTKSYLWRIERNEPHSQTGKMPNPSPDAIKKIAKALDWKLEDAFGRAGIIAENVIRRVPYSEPLAAELEHVYALQCRAFNALPPGPIRERYIASLRADAEFTLDIAVSLKSDLHE